MPRSDRGCPRAARTAQAVRPHHGRTSPPTRQNPQRLRLSPELPLPSPRRGGGSAALMNAAWWRNSNVRSLLPGGPGRRSSVLSPVGGVHGVLDGAVVVLVLLNRRACPAGIHWEGPVVAPGGGGPVGGEVIAGGGDCTMRPARQWRTCVRGSAGRTQNSARPSWLVSAMTGRGWAGRPSRRSGPAAAATAGAVSASHAPNRAAASR